MLSYASDVIWGHTLSWASVLRLCSCVWNVFKCARVCMCTFICLYTHEISVWMLRTYAAMSLLRSVYHCSFWLDSNDIQYNRFIVKKSYYIFILFHFIHFYASVPLSSEQLSLSHADDRRASTPELLIHKCNRNSLKGNNHFIKHPLKNQKVKFAKLIFLIFLLKITFKMSI